MKPLHQAVNVTYQRYFVPGIIFMVMFAFLVPLCYALILYSIRNHLQVGLPHFWH